MEKMNIPFKIDLASNRIVYPNDTKIGIREIEFLKGSTYSGQISLISGALPVSATIEDFSFSISETDKKDTPFIQTSDISPDGIFSFYVASPTLDYAINGKDELRLETNIYFKLADIAYDIDSLSTIIENIPGLTPAEEYYPLNDNPKNYITQSELPKTVTVADSTALFALTSNDVNIGDRVIVTTGDTGSTEYYEVLDITNLNSYTGFATLKDGPLSIDSKKIVSENGSMIFNGPDGVERMRVSGGEYQDILGATCASIKISNEGAEPIQINSDSLGQLWVNASAVNIMSPYMVWNSYLELNVVNDLYPAIKLGTNRLSFTSGADTEIATIAGDGLHVTGGFGIFGKLPPLTQPTIPTSVNEVITKLQPYGLFGAGTPNLSFAGSTIAGTTLTLSADATLSGTNNTAPNQVGQTPTNSTLLVKSQADGLYATTAQGTKADNAVPQTTTVNGHALNTNITVTKADVGLGSVDNTSDVNKPVSTAQAAAIALKQDASTAVTLTGIQTLTNKTLTSPAINTPTGIVKSDVGLGNVDNTSDIDKPISTATQTALDLKANNNITLTAGSGLSGGGDLSANRTISLNTANANTWTGTQTFSLAPVLSTLPVGAVPFVDSTNAIIGNTSKLYWAEGAGYSRLGIGTGSPSAKLTVYNTTTENVFSALNFQSSVAGGSLTFNVDSAGRTNLNVTSTNYNTYGGAYFNAIGYEEAWFNVTSLKNTSGKRVMRFGNLGNRFSIQLLNDTNSGITSTPFSIANEAPTNSFYMDSAGSVGIGAIPSSAKFQVASTLTTLPTAIIRGTTSQTADLQQWQDSTGNVLAKIDASGNATLNGTNNTAPNQIGQIPTSSSLLVKSQADILYSTALIDRLSPWNYLNFNMSTSCWNITGTGVYGTYNNIQTALDMHCGGGTTANSIITARVNPGGAVGCLASFLGSTGWSTPIAINVWLGLYALPTLTTSDQYITMLFGSNYTASSLADFISTISRSGIGFSIVYNASGNHLVAHVQTGTYTATDLGLLPARPYRIRISTTTPGQWSFYVNGVLFGTVAGPGGNIYDEGTILFTMSNGSATTDLRTQLNGLNILKY